MLPHYIRLPEETLSRLHSTIKTSSVRTNVRQLDGEDCLPKESSLVSSVTTDPMNLLLEAVKKLTDDVQ